MQNGLVIGKRISGYSPLEYQLMDTLRDVAYDKNINPILPSVQRARAFLREL